MTLNIVTFAFLFSSPPSAAGINSGILNALMFVTTMQLFGNKKGKFIWGYINVMLAVGKFEAEFNANSLAHGCLLLQLKTSVSVSINKTHSDKLIFKSFNLTRTC